MRCKDSPSFRHLAFLRLGCCRCELRFDADDWILVVLRQYRAEHVKRADIGRGLAASVRVSGKNEVYEQSSKHPAALYQK